MKILDKNQWQYNTQYFEKLNLAWKLVTLQHSYRISQTKQIDSLEIIKHLTAYIKATKIARIDKGSEILNF